MPQAAHGAAVVFRAQVALRAVFVGNVGEASGHDGNGEGGGQTPVVVDAVGGVVGVPVE